MNPNISSDELTSFRPPVEAIAHFYEHGWLRLPRAFDPGAAEAMRETVWRELADSGIHPDDPSTWLVERPAHLQRLKDHPIFREIASRYVLATIDTLLVGQTYVAPKNWGALFIAFPSKQDWGVPTSGWHIDAKYTSPLSQPGGVKTLALFGDVAPRCGGTQILSGSHRLVHTWLKENPPPPRARSADIRQLLQAQPYIRALHTEGDADERIRRFMSRAEYTEGVSLRVVEITGSAGDVFFLHPLMLHVAAPNAGNAPRFMVSGGVTTDNWGWATPSYRGAG